VGHFAAIGRKLAQRTGWPVFVFGSNAESADCAAVAREIGAGALNVAGQTTLPDLAILLAHCGVVIANDSGGMHLAAAVGAPVVGIFGLTDPDTTGPIGHRTRVVRPMGIAGNRAIKRDSKAARDVLAGITPEAVYETACELLE
jgi:ADP-heptose:LPS heptosyltransferase